MITRTDTSRAPRDPVYRASLSCWAANGRLGDRLHSRSYQNANFLKSPIVDLARYSFADTIRLFRALTEGAEASFAHWQNFSVARLNFPFRVTIPIATRFGSGVTRTSANQSPKAWGTACLGRSARADRQHFILV